MDFKKLLFGLTLLMVFGNGVAAELIATGQEGSYQSTLITAILILNIYYIWSIRLQRHNC